MRFGMGIKISTVENGKQQHSEKGVLNMFISEPKPSGNITKEILSNNIY